MDKILNEKQLLLRSLVLTLDFESLLELMFGAFIFACRSKDQAPDDPVIRIERLLLDALPDLLDGFHYITLLKLSEGPMHVCVVTVAIELLGLAADVEGLFVYHVHVKQEGQIVVGVRVRVVDQDAPFKVLHCLRVVADFEVRKP